MVNFKRRLELKARSPLRTHCWKLNIIWGKCPELHASTTGFLKSNCIFCVLWQYLLRIQSLFAENPKNLLSLQRQISEAFILLNIWFIPMIDKKLHACKSSMSMTSMKYCATILDTWFLHVFHIIQSQTWPRPSRNANDNLTSFVCKLWKNCFLRN
jgi:hypothetical protein